MNGTAIPHIAVSPTPARSASFATDAAIAKVNDALKANNTLKTTAPVTARRTQLMVFQAGLAQGIPHGTHLVWEIEVGNGKNVREFVFVDAHNGKVVDQITGTLTDSTAAPMMACTFLTFLPATRTIRIGRKGTPSPRLRRKPTT